MSASERLVEADNEFLGRCNFLDHSSQLLRILRAVPVGDVDPLGLRAAYPLPVQLPQSLHRPFPATHLVEDGDMPGFISPERGFSCSMGAQRRRDAGQRPGPGGETSGHLTVKNSHRLSRSRSSEA